MDHQLSHKALVLWREFARNTRRLDVEALDALELREELESAELDAADRQSLRELDLEVRRDCSRIVDDLTKTGALGMIQDYREDNDRRGVWWWLDHLAAGEPIPPRAARARRVATAPAGTTPRPVHSLHALPVAEPSIGRRGP